MVNSTRTSFSPLPVRQTRNRREVYVFPNNVRESSPPSVSASQNVYEKSRSLSNEAEGFKPSYAGNQIEGHVVTFVTQEGAKQVELTPHVTHIEQETRECLQNGGNRLEPLAAAAPIVAPHATEYVQNEGSSLQPIASTDQLEGYQPRYFLKEDGKDDVS